MLAIKISNVSKQYGHAAALSGVSLSVEAGEIFGFLGPNGAGKTTTIRCLMDFIRPNSGSISIFGLDAQADSVKVKRQVGFLSADSQLYANWNAHQHISFIQSVRGGTNTSAELLKRLDLDPAVPVHRLSTGNKQKLGLVLALMNRPKLVILDEPSSGLDPLLQHEIYAILGEYVADGGTVFLSSHNLAEVERLCTNVGVIRQGKIVASMSMAEILAMNIHLVTVSYPAGAKPLPPDFPSAAIVSQSDSHMVLKVRGDINPLVHHLGRHHLTDLEITHAPLEDIFMEYYRGRP